MKKWSFSNKFVLIVGLFFASQAFALDCATGTGWGDFLTQEATKDTTDDYYKIDTPEKLAWISCKMKHDNANFKRAKVKLTQSIDMQGNLGKVFIPIAAGTGTPPSFNGIFDGQGFTISNLYIKASEINNAATSAHTGKSKNGNAAYAQNIGLFGIISKETINKVDFIGTVKNLTLKDVQIYAASSAGSTGISNDKPISVGAVVGWVSDGGIIENCVASGTIETSGATNRVGGIAGNVKSVTISNCVSSVSVTASGASTNVGGIVGALRNGGNVNISSCVYSGNNLYTVDGSVGAIAGSYESVNKLSTEDLYYSDEFCKELDEGEACSGIGTKPDTVTFNANSTDNLNSEEVVCNLNCGSWDEGTCTGDTSDVWSIGQTNISMNGSDGYKITFNANGGTFAPGAKTTKILAKDATITADEIGVPTREGKKFAGWATKADTTEPSSNLGVAHAAVTVYAVWYDFYTVTFETNPETHATQTVQVPKHGTVSVEGFAVPGIYLATDPDNAENTIKYYFTGWGNSSKMLDVGVDPTAEDTVHLADIDVVDNVNLYAVWTKAKTFSVTFDATLHGKTDVRIIKIVNEGDPVSEPDPSDIISDAGYVVAGWCLVESCTESNEYDFDTPLEGNLLLYARWNVVQYSISYENMNGASNAGNPSNYNIGSGDIVFAAPTKEGATFDGWFYDQEFTNPATQIGAGSTGDKTIYAKWTVTTYTIQYLSGTVISATVPGTTKTYGETITLKDAPSQFAVGGCTFDGWSKVDYGQEGYAVDYAFGAKYADNANLKLFPHWTSCGTYTITYELYGVEATNRNPSTYTGPVKVTLENAFVSDNPVKMDNWYLEPTFKTSIRYLQGINKDMTLYAKWYSVITFQPGTKLKNFNKDAGKVEKQKNLNNAYTLGIPNNKYAITNYTLDGWSLTDGGEKVYDVGFDYTDNVSITLYPHWVESRDSVQYGAVKIYTYAIDGRQEAVIDGSSEETITIPHDIEVYSVTYDRQFTKNQFSTIVLPFSIDTSNISGGSLYSLNTVVKGPTGKWDTVKVSLITGGTAVANKPYLFKSKEGVLTFTGAVTLKDSSSKVDDVVDNGDGSTWTLKGAFSKKTFEDGDAELGRAYGFVAKATDKFYAGQFAKAGVGAWLKPMRAYLVYNSENSMGKSASVGATPSLADIPETIHVQVLDAQGNVTESGSLNTVTGEFKMDRWYDLQGRKLNAKPTVQGTYYHNGERVIVK